jgi:hypothetical protein
VESARGCQFWKAFGRMPNVESARGCQTLTASAGERGEGLRDGPCKLRQVHALCSPMVEVMGRVLSGISSARVHTRHVPGSSAHMRRASQGIFVIELSSRIHPVQQTFERNH